MNPELLAYYNRELRFATARAKDFARGHAKIARRMGMQAGEIGDPYVERLLQGFAFATAHMEMRIDSEFPELMQPLLQTLYPNYACPIPAMAVARLWPGHGSGHGGQRFLIPRGTSFFACKPLGNDTICEFRSSQDVALYPLTVSLARLTGVPPDIPSLGRYVPPGRQVRSALRLRLATTNGTPISSLEDLDRLPVCLTGNERTASRLFELIHASGVATIVGAPEQFATHPFHAVTANAVVHEGLAPDQSLLPAAPGQFHGHTLLQEYFACAPRFWFFALTGLAAGLKAIDGTEVEIVILLERELESYADRVDASHFGLFATPVINLFPKLTRRLKLEPGQREHEIVVEPAAPTDYGIHSIQVAFGQQSEDSDDEPIWPLYQRLSHDETQDRRYFALRRDLSVPADDGRQYETRRSFTETKTWLSLVDGNGQPLQSDIQYLTAEAWVTNRDLPGMMTPDGRKDLKMQGSVPLAGIGFVRAPSVPRPPLAQGTVAWQLFSQLTPSDAMFDDDTADAPDALPGEGLRRRLRLFLSREAVAHRQQVEGLIGATATPVNGLMPGNRGPAFGRGIECELTFDEAGFDGISPYTLGLALEHYVARHVSMHSFTRTVLRSKQRGLIATWPARAGTRNVA
ncbi:type VI secretion system baseplate subunit TssF [Paraburkholderia adhaesiva]|uniref:type VI secretion system baseplate subunit TssF n=1 Tax=Paraburkholderia adhaesiva TaxID=2883244 RepID=UPI001F1A28FA|nr:type VI secretion system baseplate subunit TssF [Paraburkholderia adhaesiva]